MINIQLFALLNYYTPPTPCTAAHITWIDYYNGFLFIYLFSLPQLVINDKSTGSMSYTPEGPALWSTRYATIDLVIFRIDHRVIISWVTHLAL